MKLWTTNSEVNSTSRIPIQQQHEVALSIPAGDGIPSRVSARSSLSPKALSRAAESAPPWPLNRAEGCDLNMGSLRRTAKR